MPVLSTNYTSVVNVPTGKLVGRSSAGVGPLEALSIDASLLLAAGKLSLNAANQNTWTVLQNFGAGLSLASDVILTRKAAATLQLGAADAVAPVAQTLSAQSVLAGTLNTAGQNWTFNASQGTGTGGGGHIIFQTAPAGLTGTSQNALTPVLTLDDALAATFAGVVNAASSLSQAANTSADGLVLADSTPATLGNQQFSPRIRLSGQGWATTPSASRQCDWIIENQTVQGAANPASNLVFRSQVNGGGYATSLTMATGGGAVTVSPNLQCNSLLIPNSTLGITWGSSLSKLRSVADGTLQFSNFAVSSSFYVTAPATATLQLGQADAAAPVAQTLSVQNVVAGTLNTAGQNFTINGSQGTGTGAGGSIIFQTAPSGLTGTSQNALTTVLTIGTTTACTVSTPAASSIGLVVQGAASQSADLQQWKNGTGSVLAKVDSGGNLSAPSIAVATTTTVTALSITQTRNADAISVNRGAAGAVINATLTSNQSNGIVIATTDAGTALHNIPTYGVKFTGSVGADTPSITGVYSNVTQSRTTAVGSTWPDLAIGVDASAYSSIADAGSWGYAGRFTAGTPNIVGLLVQGAASQTADLQQWKNSGGTAIASIDNNGQCHASAFIPPFTKKTAAYTLTVNDNIVTADATTASFAVNLPAANSLTAGRSFTIKKIDASANAVTLTAAGTDKIDGAATYALSAQYKYVTVTTDGVSNWYVTANN